MLTLYSSIRFWKFLYPHIVDSLTAFPNTNKIVTQTNDSNNSSNGPWGTTHLEISRDTNGFDLARKYNKNLLEEVIELLEKEWNVSVDEAVAPVSSSLVSNSPMVLIPLPVPLHDKRHIKNNIYTDNDAFTIQVRNTIIMYYLYYIYCSYVLLVYSLFDMNRMPK